MYVERWLKAPMLKADGVLGCVFLSLDPPADSGRPFRSDFCTRSFRR